MKELSFDEICDLVEEDAELKKDYDIVSLCRVSQKTNEHIEIIEDYYRSIIIGE